MSTVVASQASRPVNYRATPGDPRLAPALPRIGLLGGSFDPVHCAHLALAHAALAHLPLAGVQLLPARAPWQRAPLAASAEHRLAMLELAVTGLDGVSVNPLELHRDGPTYTIDTVRALPPDACYTWLLGADQLQNFCTWRDWQAIAARLDLAVAARPGAPLTAPPALAAHLEALGKGLHILPFAEQAVSASSLRAQLARGEAPPTIPRTVLAYIHTHRLYREP